jgi:hypothetical protein
LPSLSGCTHRDRIRTAASRRSAPAPTGSAPHRLCRNVSAKRVMAGVMDPWGNAQRCLQDRRSLGSRRHAQASLCSRRSLLVLAQVVHVGVALRSCQFSSWPSRAYREPAPLWLLDNLPPTDRRPHRRRGRSHRPDRRSALEPREDPRRQWTDDRTGADRRPHRRRRRSHRHDRRSTLGPTGDPQRNWRKLDASSARGREPSVGGHPEGASSSYEDATSPPKRRAPTVPDQRIVNRSLTPWGWWVRGDFPVARRRIPTIPCALTMRQRGQRMINGTAMRRIADASASAARSITAPALRPRVPTPPRSHRMQIARRVDDGR